MSNSTKTTLMFGVIFGVIFLVFISSNKPAINQSVNRSVDSQPAQIEPMIIRNSVTKVFDLKAGQSTGWIGFEEGRTADVSYSSPDYDYFLIYSDGTSYKCSRNAVIPEKYHCYVNIKANSNQLVTMVIKYR
jgi:hypothetical protein